MSHFKLENSKFYESIDLLCDDLVVSEEKNKVGKILRIYTLNLKIIYFKLLNKIFPQYLKFQNLKNQMKQLDRMIETLMKEKNSLKATISKFNPTLAEETSKKNNK